MAECNIAAPEKDGVVKTDYVWGAKVNSSYKSVTIRGELFSLGDCVRCPLKSKSRHIGKIVRLFEKDGMEMCRIRSFYSLSEFSVSVKGLDYNPESKELFLASGEGPAVERDILLEKIAGRCVVLCTAEESLNEVPSGEQVEAADHFFLRGYDPAGEEVVGLDCVEEAIGAQKVFNRKEWLVPVDKTLSRSSSQVSASRMHRQSPAVSGSSSQQGAAKGMHASISEVPPAMSGDSTERKMKKRKSNNMVPEPLKVNAVRKMKKRKSNNMVPEPLKVNAVEKIKELHIPKCETSATPRKGPAEVSKHLIFALPAPAKIDPSRKQKSLPIKKIKPPISSTSKAKEVQPVGKGESMSKMKARQPETKGDPLRVSSSSITSVGSKPKTGTIGGAVTGETKRKRESTPSTEWPSKKIVKPVERSSASVEREKPSKLQKRSPEGVAFASSRGAEQKPPRIIFKPKAKEWDIDNLAPAIISNRVLLLQNLVPGLHSDDLAEALTQYMSCRCDVRIAPPVSPSHQTTSALLKLPSPTLALKVLEKMKTQHVNIAGRLVSISHFKPNDFKVAPSKTLGHIRFHEEKRDYLNENYRDAVATSHLAQGNTIEFDYGLPWLVLDDQHEEQWRILHEELNSQASNGMKRTS